MNKHSLIDFMRLASREMQSEYERIQSRVKEDPGTAGDEGEENWAEILRRWLPANFTVVTKGRIINHSGEATPQLDIIVLKPEYPPALVNKKLYLSAGVVAAFECKITFRKRHLDKLFSNSVKVKSIVGKGEGTPYKELNSSVIYGLLAHSHEWETENEDIINKISGDIESTDYSYIRHPSQMPDIICIADLAGWSAFKTCMLKASFVDNEWAIARYSLPDGSMTALTTSYRCGNRFIWDNEDKGFTPIGYFIKNLYNKLSFTKMDIIELANYFEKSLPETSSSYERHWGRDVYSEDVISEIHRRDAHRETDKQWYIMF